MLVSILLVTIISVAYTDFTVSRKSDLSRSSSWRCGFFLVNAKGGPPEATFFVVQQHFPAQCPTKRFRTRGWEKECNIQGENWAKRWDPDQGSSRGKNGDKVCKIAQKELGGDIPNKEFPIGIQVTLPNILDISFNIFSV